MNNEFKDILRTMTLALTKEQLATLLKAIEEAESEHISEFEFEMVEIAGKRLNELSPELYQKVRGITFEEAVELQAEIDELDRKARKFFGE